jgi:hypothetical protein
MWRRLRSATAMTAVALCVVLLAGCNSGAVVAPDGDTGGSDEQAANQGGGNGNGGNGGGGGGGNGGGGGGGGGDERYTWGLPVGDTSVSLNEAIVYIPLQKGNCGEAQARLDDEPLWKGFRSPRNVLLFQAAIHLCSGRVAAARPLFQRAEADYGWGGLAPGGIVCETYLASASVIRQQPKSAFTCVGGEPPPWRGEYPNLDDPRTAVDESTTTTSTTTTTTSTSLPPAGGAGDGTTGETTTSLGGG